MQQQQRYTLGKSDKLKSKKSIEQLFSEGKSFSVFPLRVLYLHNATHELQKSNLAAAFSVSKKYFKKAVHRNRIKRLLRECWRLQKNRLAAGNTSNNKNLLVFIIYTGNELPEYDLVFEKVGTVIKRLIKISNETPVTNT